MEQIYKSKLVIERLDNPDLIEVAKNLKMQGVLLQDENYSYLKIDDSFIHNLFSLIPDSKNLQKPDYFCEKDNSGAHITITYPEEGILIKDDDINVIHSFEITELIKTRVGLKEYYVLMVSSPSLSFLRKKYNLPPMLNFKGYNIGLHITIATSKSGE